MHEIVDHDRHFAEEETVKKVNKDFAVNHLYRIFVYERGKSREHDLSIRAFQDFLHGKSIEYSTRALYDYAEGKLPFPAALVPFLIEFSGDRKLVELFLPLIKTVVNELKTKYAIEKVKLKQKIQAVERAEEDLSLED